MRSAQGLIGLAIILFCCNKAVAQEKFIGTVTFERTYFHNTKTNHPPDELFFAYDGGRMVMKSVFMGGQNLSILDVDKDSLYEANAGQMTFQKESLDTRKFEWAYVAKTDSFKTILGYKCRGYTISLGDVPGTWLWLNENMVGINIKNRLLNTTMKIYGLPYVMMGMETYNSGKLYSSFAAANITKMDHAPDSLFNLSAYTEKRPWSLSEDRPKEEVIEGIPGMNAKVPVTDQPVTKPEQPAVGTQPKKTVPVKKPAAKPKTKPAAKKPGKVE